MAAALLRAARAATPPLLGNNLAMGIAQHSCAGQQGRRPLQRMARGCRSGTAVVVSFAYGLIFQHEAVSNTLQAAAGIMVLLAGMLHILLLGRTHGCMQQGPARGQGGA
jgi:hypothetical protein